MTSIYAKDWRVIHHPGDPRYVVSDAQGYIVRAEENATPADMQLIAAAPDLKEALTELWGFVEDLQKSNPGYLGKLCLQDYARFNRALSWAPAALAKANGEAP